MKNYVTFALVLKTAPKIFCRIVGIIKQTLKTMHTQFHFHCSNRPRPAVYQACPRACPLLAHQDFPLVSEESPAFPRCPWRAPWRADSSPSPVIPRVSTASLRWPRPRAATLQRKPPRPRPLRQPQEDSTRSCNATHQRQ